MGSSPIAEQEEAEGLLAGPAAQISNGMPAGLRSVKVLKSSSNPRQITLSFDFIELPLYPSCEFWEQSDGAIRFRDLSFLVLSLGLKTWLPSA